jgi:voltage-gated sodium channel
MTALCRRISESRLFQNAILGVIVFTAVVMGLETSARLMSSWGGAFRAINAAIQVIFVTEIVIRILACGPRYHRFFTNGWNLFDFLIVSASLMPQTGAFANIARVARLLRVVRVVSVSEELRLIVATMLRSIPSLGHVTLLLSLLLYVYGVLGYHSFHSDDPEHWGTLARSLMTLFQILTLEGWVEVMRATEGEHPWAWAFYGSYVVIAVFVVVNLFIAVVLNNLETAKADYERERDAAGPRADALERLRAIRAELDRLEEEIRGG